MKTLDMSKVVSTFIFIFLFFTASQTRAGQAFLYVLQDYGIGTDVRDNAGNLLDGTDPGRDLLQIIYRGPNGQIDPPDPGDPDSLGGDDSLLRNARVGDDDAVFNVIGDGEFTLSALGTDNAWVYIRAWDAGTIGAADYYGDTVAYQLDNGLGVPPDYLPPSFSTNENKPLPATPTPTPTQPQPTVTPGPTNTPAPPTPTPVQTPEPTNTPVPPTATPATTPAGPTATPTSEPTVVPLEVTATPTPRQPNFLELEIRERPGGGWDFQAGETLVLHWRVYPELYDYRNASLTIYLGALLDPAKVDTPARVTDVFAGGPVFLFGRGMKAERYDARNVKPAFKGVAFPPVKTEGELSFIVPGGVGKDLAFAAAFINMKTGRFVTTVTPVEISNECRLPAGATSKASEKGFLRKLLGI